MLGTGTSRCKGAHFGEGNARLNVNVVPFGQSSEDSKNLFADLNPFQIKGTGKSFIPNKSSDNKIEELQKPNIGHPPVPLWKNRVAFNAVPNKNEYDYMEGRFPRVSRRPNDHNMALSSSSNSTVSENVNPGGSGTSTDLSVSIRSAEVGSSSSNMNSRPTSAIIKPNILPLIDEQNRKSNGEHSGNTDMEDEKVDAIDGRDNLIRFDSRRKFTYDRSVGTNLILKDPGSPSLLVNPSSNRFEQVYDDVDVGQCEIQWEDLIIGERIGLGTPLLIRIFLSISHTLYGQRLEIKYLLLHSMINLISKLLSLVMFKPLKSFTFDSLEIFIFLLLISCFLYIGSYGEVYHADWNGTVSYLNSISMILHSVASLPILNLAHSIFIFFWTTMFLCNLNICLFSLKSMKSLLKITSLIQVDSNNSLVSGYDKMPDLLSWNYQTITIR